MGDDALVTGILSDALWILAWIGLGLTALSGLLLTLIPGKALFLAERLNQEYSTGWLKRLLDSPRTSEPWLYRHHRVVGTAMTLGSVYFFWRFFTDFRVETIASLYEGVLPMPVLEALAITTTTILVSGNMLAFVLGLVLFARPSLLKPTESWANRWVASDRAGEALDMRVGSPEKFAHRYPRRVGLLLLFGAVYVGLVLGTLGAKLI